jgi:uncharacterized protein (DUF2235 family)
MTRLAVFFDGTWNTPTDRTNVDKLFKLLDGGAPAQQRGTYVQGVGTASGGLMGSFWNALGGAFGDGLSENICSGYRWLAENFRAGDQIFLFGFSRGAYTARSLAGLIRHCGIVHADTLDRIDDAYKLYRKKLPADSDPKLRFREQFATETSIEFVGVWDTVGSLGVPIGGLDFPGFSGSYDFHDTNLSSKVLAAYHALAIHEFRSPYQPTFWTSDKARDLPVEQRWFLGAHSNVGGGYTDDQLCNLSCRWMQKMAQRHGLRFASDWPVGPEDYAYPVRPSYDEFLKDHPAAGKMIAKIDRKPGGARSLNETIDASALEVLNDVKLRGEWPALVKALEHLPQGE